MKIKSLLLAAALFCASAPAFATTYALLPNATDGETQIPYNLYGWWNFGNDPQADGSSKIFAADGSADCSAGWFTPADAGLDFAELADLDLVFDAKVEGIGTWIIRLTNNKGVQEDYTLEVPADEKFYQQRIHVADKYPAVIQNWRSGNTDGAYTFAVVGTKLASGAALYINNVKYVDAVAMPTLEASASDITETSATLNWTATFPEGYTNTSVTVNGEAVSGNSLVLNDLTPNTAYTYTVEAKGDINGQTMTVAKGISFKTLRPAGQLPVWYGVTDKPGFSAEYSITYNADKTLSVAAVIVTEKETATADRNFHIYIGGDEWLKLYDDGTGTLTGTTVSTFEEGSTITWEWYLPYAGGVYQQANNYVVGSENEKPLSIRISAKAQNVSFDGAEISYTVTAPDENYKVYYKAVDGDAVLATANPIVLTGLAENTEYSYEVYAVLGEGADAIESAHAAVNFKTTHKDAVDLVYADLFAAEFKNAFLPGEDESARRSIFTTLPWSVTYRADGTAVYSVDLSSVENIVGMVPQIYWNGFQHLTKNAENGRYEYEFGAQELDAVTAISHYFAYAGGVVDVRTPYTNWGMEKEAPVLGEAANLKLSASKDGVMTEEAVNLSAVATDANGLYVASDAITYSTGDGATIAGNTFTAAKKGAYEVVANLGDLSATIVINVIGTKDCNNLAAGLVGATDEANIQGGTVENVTDADRNSQLEWRCTETEEHYLILDLGKPYYIHGIDLYFEGAYATEFTVTLSATIPAELVPATPSARRAAAQDVTFTPVANNTQHYFTQEPSGTHQYVALRTSKALNTGWGIKVRDLKVYGSEKAPSTTLIENIVNEDENAPVEYYNLNGMRVDNPENGLYLRRQGSKVSKVLVK